MNTVNDAASRLKRARETLVLDHVFFGALAVRLSLIEETRGRTRTMATDGLSIFYDKDYVKRCTDAELITLLAHEVMHPAMQHHTRRGERDPSLWNEAADYAINAILEEAGFTLPVGLLLDRKYSGMTAEQIYDALSQPGNPDKDDGNEENDGTRAGSPSDDDSRAQGGDGGESGASENNLADKPGAVFDAPDPIEQSAEWRVALKQATQAARMMGQLPAGIALAVDEVMKPRIDWKALLRRFVQECASDDYAWGMPNRRYMASGLHLPEVRSESMPPIAVVVDSSASTSNVLSIFKAELQSIVDECQPEATIVMMVDAEVHRVDRFERDEPIEFNVVGFGGTDFRPAFEYIDRQQLDPACLIYLTDGDGVYPERPSEYPTLWVITTPHHQAPWGETVAIEPRG
jgi:predicted metal-dependent peptidase